MNKDNNKVNAEDTLKDMGEALKKDYDSTKADMKSMKDKAEDTFKGEKDMSKKDESMDSSGMEDTDM